MSEGTKYIKENFITELSYEEAIRQVYEGLNELGIYYSTNIYDRDDIYDEPMYPCNAELYDEFVDEYGFYFEGFYSFVCRYMENRM